MVVLRAGAIDPTLSEIQQCLEAYQRDHPQSELAFYRRSPRSVRIRVIDPRFAGMRRVERHREISRYLAPLVLETKNAIGLVVAVTPSELTSSGSNREFEDPSPAESTPEQTGAER
jgi:stress-induced morphogen